MNNTFFVLALFALLTIVALSVVTIYNYISCLTLKLIYEECLNKQENKLNNELNNIKKGTQLILEDKVTKTKSSNIGTTIKRTPKLYAKSNTNITPKAVISVHNKKTK